MGLLKTVFWFIVTNIAVLVMINIIFIILGLFGINIDPQSQMGLILFSLVVGFSGSIISLLLSKTMALRSVNGRVIKQPSNEEEAWLLQRIEFLANQWNFKMPTVAIYESQELNAFATGPTKNNSLMAISTGLLRNMTRDEVEGVIGHELSHIGNGDMVTMTLVQGVVNTFVIYLSRILSNILASMVNERMQYMAYILVNMVLQVIFGFLASIIVLWFSRRREYKADLGSAKILGRNKMIAALTKLKQLSNRDNDNPEPQVANTFGINGGKDSLFSTHPSLDNRIKVLQSMTIV